MRLLDKYTVEIDKKSEKQRIINVMLNADESPASVVIVNCLDKKLM